MDHPLAIGAIRKPRQLERDAVQAVVQVFAELATRDHLAQVAVRSGDDVQVYLQRRLATEWDDLLLFQYAQQPSLQGQWHVADLIQEQRAAGGLKDLALHPFLACAGERAGLIAEQL